MISYAGPSYFALGQQNYIDDDRWYKTELASVKI